MSYFGTDPGDLTPEEMYGRGSVPAPRPSEPLPCPFCGSKAVMNTTGAGCTNTECDAHLANVYLRTWNRRSPSVPTATQEQREAFLLAANVASIIRDEYETLAKQEGVSRQQRERFNRDATVARQVKGQILAYAGIQEWPAPKPSSPPVSSSEEAANSDTRELQIAGMPIRVDPSVPPNEIQAWQNGRCVFRLVNIHDNEMLKVRSEPR